MWRVGVWCASVRARASGSACVRACARPAACERVRVRVRVAASAPVRVRVRPRAYTHHVEHSICLVEYQAAGMGAEVDKAALDKVV